MTRLINKIRLVVKYGPNILVSVPSRLLFGNTNRLFSDNLRPFIAFLLKGIGRHKNEHSTCLSREGFLCLPNTLEPDFMKDLKQEFSRALSSESLHTQTTQHVISVVDYTEISELVLKIYKNDFIQQVLEGYFGVGKFELKSWNAWRNLTASSNEYVYSNFWHFDRNNLKSLRIFVNLQDADSGTGATRVINKKRTRQLTRTFGFTHTSLRSGRFIHEEYVNFAGGPLGTVVFFNPQEILHAATVPTMIKFRDAIQLVVDN